MFQPPRSALESLGSHYRYLCQPCNLRVPGQRLPRRINILVINILVTRHAMSAQDILGLINWHSQFCQPVKPNLS